VQSIAKGKKLIKSSVGNLRLKGKNYSYYTQANESVCIETIATLVAFIAEENSNGTHVIRS
jgi:hypothetical protein